MQQFKLAAAGRNNLGQITVRHKKAPQKCLRPIVDELRSNLSLSARVIKFIKIKHKKLFALIQYSSGALAYICAENSMFFKTVTKSFIFFIFYAAVLFLKKRLVGSVYFLLILKQNERCFNVACTKQKTWLAKASGAYCKILYISKDLNFYFLKLPSGQKKKFKKTCAVTFGTAANLNVNKIIVSAAGMANKCGTRPTVRGVAMNPVDHPHGGRTKTNKPEVSPWGWVAKNNK